MNKSALLVVSGLGLIVGFFLPWAFKASGLDLATASSSGWSHRVFFLIPAFGALSVGLALANHRARIGAALLSGIIGFGLTIFLWTKAMPTDKIEFWIVVGAAAAAVYLIATRAEPILCAIPGVTLVGAYFFRLDVPLTVMVLGAALALAGGAKHRSHQGLAIALGIVVVAPMVEMTSRAFHRGAEYGMWLVLASSVLAIGSGIAASSRKNTDD